MARPIKRLHGEPDVVKDLRRRSRSTTIGVRDRERAEIILLRLDGVGVEAVAERLKTTPKRVSLWSGRFETLGLKGLDDKPGRGRKPSIPNAKVARVVTEATRPPKSKARWSIRSMSRHAGISASSVQRIWSKNDLKPHRVKTFKLSNDPKFEEKFCDRTLPRSTGQSARVVLRREKPMPGARTCKFARNNDPLRGDFASNSDPS